MFHTKQNFLLNCERRGGGPLPGSWVVSSREAHSPPIAFRLVFDDKAGENLDQSCRQHSHRSPLFALLFFLFVSRLQHILPFIRYWLSFFVMMCQAAGCFPPFRHNRIGNVERRASCEGSSRYWAIAYQTFGPAARRARNACPENECLIRIQCEESYWIGCLCWVLALLGHIKKVLFARKHTTCCNAKNFYASRNTSVQLENHACWRSSQQAWHNFLLVRFGHLAIDFLPRCEIPFVAAVFAAGLLCLRERPERGETTGLYNSVFLEQLTRSDEICDKSNYPRAVSVAV